MIIDTIQNFFNELDAKNWIRFLIAFAAGLLLLIALYFFLYYRSVNAWKRKIDEINEQRDEARVLLTKAHQVRKERREITTMLEEDPDFKIKGYLQALLNRLGLSRNITTENDTTLERDDAYRENIVSYQFTGITMKLLTELLNEVEQNKRLFVKELDISKSKKVAKAIDVSITIATMQPKVT